ncbi:rhodanese-like domain-containing protein [Metabacillus fastidiosus]|uniref:rhodanese-like domain-containing protein n=1 Tax=Metabacillus fastidiosus TaxID=1458 RepID=UPI003D295F91
MKYFAVILKKSKDELASEYLDAHIEYLERLRIDGIVTGNGRLLDGEGGLIIYRGQSLEEVKEQVEEDPFIIHKIRNYEIYEWAVKWAPHTGLDGIKEIEPEDLKSRLAEGDKPVIIDVREEEEVKQGIIPDAKHIPLGDLVDRYEEIEQTAEVFFICRGGRRSLKACEFLKEKGYKNLINISGGMTKWNKL